MEIFITISEKLIFHATEERVHHEFETNPVIFDQLKN